MIEIRQIIIVFGFLTLCAGGILFSLKFSMNQGVPLATSQKSSTDKKSDVSTFTFVNYYLIQDERPFFHLDASQLNINNLEGKTSFLDPMGIIYDSKQAPVYYQALRGHYLQKKEELFLEDKVVVNTKDSKLRSDQVHYIMPKDKLNSMGNVKTRSFYQKSGDKIYINADSAVSWPKSKKANYYGSVVGKIKRKRVYEESIDFKSDKLYLDETQGKAKLVGSVFLKKQDSKAYSRWGELFLNNYNNKLKYYVLYDDVKVIETVALGNGEIITRRAYGEKLEGIVSEDKVILTGYPKVFQGTDIIKGKRIILIDNNEVIEVDDAITDFIIKKD